jgi:ribA/ribD-fused uncharacterized protein
MSTPLRISVNDPDAVRKSLADGTLGNRFARRGAKSALHKMRSQDMLLFYDRRESCLSNFSAHVIEFEVMGELHFFLTAEHAYQASKFTDPDIIKKIGLALSPHQAKLIAHEHRNQYRTDWCEEVKLDLMDRIIQAKLKQHYREIAPVLITSGDKMIVENSSQDSFWGWGSNKKGLNWLGELWMRRRKELRQRNRR